MHNFNKDRSFNSIVSELLLTIVFAGVAIACMAGLISLFLNFF